MTDKSPIKYIIFDLSEVLLTGIKGTGEALTEKHGLKDKLSHEVGWTHIQTPLLIPQVEDFFHGHISEDEYIRAVLCKHPELGEAEWLKSHIRENFLEVPGTREIALRLKSLGYTLALLSIHSKEWIDYCEEKFKFQEIFNTCIYSYDAKLSKPDIKSFEHALEKIGARPPECIFIDDAQRNITSAESLGIKSILFTDAENLKKDLKKLLSDF